MRSQKTSSDRPKKNASATAVRNARKCAGQSGQKSKVQKIKSRHGIRLLHVKSIKTWRLPVPEDAIQRTAEKKTEAGRKIIGRLLQSQSDYRYGASIFL